METPDIDALLSDLKEIEELLQFPSVTGHMQKSLRLATSARRLRFAVCLCRSSRIGRS
jgi:hypothetical protein